MPYFTTVSGKKMLHFSDFAEYDKTVDEYDKKLSIPVTNEKGEKVVQLIGIDGKPTTDERVFSSRQQIMLHLKEMKRAYLQSEFVADSTLVGFYNRNAIVEGTMMSKYMSLDELYKQYKEAYIKNWHGLEEYYKEYMQNAELAIARNMDLLIESLYDTLLAMKNIVNQMIKISTNIMVLNITNHFIERGLDFFEDTSYFEYSFAPHLEELQNEIRELHQKLKHNRKAESVSDFVF